MMAYNYLFLNLSVVLVMCFQVNFYFNSVFDKSSRKPNRMMYFIIFGLLNFLYLTVYLTPTFSSILALFVIFSLAHSYNVEIKTKIIFSILYAVLITIVNLLSLYILYAVDSVKISNFSHLSGQDHLIFSKVMLLSCIIMFAVIQIIRLFAKRRTFPLQHRYYFLFLIVPIISIYQVNVLSVYSEKNMYYFGSIIGFISLNVFIIYIFDNVIEKFQLMHENAQLQHQMDYQDANYEKTVHSFKNIKRIIHDTHQQFLYIDECIKRNELAEASEHIKITLNKIEGAYQRVNTGNLVIDALVTNSLNIGQANGIKVDTQLNLYSQKVNIERYDLCVALGNMLDNAIEASKKVKIAEDRFILIKIHSNESALFIHILNHMENEVAHLQSLKSNPDIHGIGLTNISRICDKYGGNMTIETKNKVFDNMVLLPFYKDIP
ncbi:GHKL domain-containing protein [Paenibacillus sp. P2(2022)]|nr:MULTISPECIES: ATP-binding protein [Paenibacillus]AUS26703.1 histidine kinase [Paenibacillus polymyxa]KJK28312.1 histidine kinase [Paenibacillus polymyxa]MDG0053408.1 GHKL domain-containing protein [Paenibacillus sp. P2(2022)]